MPTLENGLNLAYWLYKVHPELYARLVPLATRARGRLGTLSDDFLPGISTFDPSSSIDTFSIDSFQPLPSDAATFTFDPTSNPLATITPDIASIGTPDLTNITVDTSGFTTPAFQPEPDPTGSIWDSIGSGLQSVGSWLTSSQGLSSLSSIANTVLKANAPAQATVNTQVQRVAAGSNPAPLTYGVNASGQVVPILTRAGTGSGIGLTFQSLQKLVPTAWQPYVAPTLIGLGAWLLFKMVQRRR